MGAIDQVIKALPVVGGIYGAISNIGAEGRQVEQQEKLQELQIKGAKELAEQQRINAMKMWNDTNVGAQVEHLEEAGMNPALLYGKGGMGGATTGSGGMPMPTGATAASVDPNAKTRTIMELGMMMANKALIESQTRKNNVEADATAGVKTAEGQQNIAESKSRQAMNEVNTKYANESIEFRLDMIAQEANKALGEAQSALAKGNVDQVTVDSKIAQVRQEATNAAITAAAMESGIQLNNAKINEITQDIQRKWQELTMNQSKTRYEHEDRLTAIKEYTSNALKTAGIIAAGNIVGDVVKIATRQIPKGNISTTTNGAGQTISETYTRPN